MNAIEMSRILPPQCLREINEKFMFYYTVNKDDMRKCPNEQCDYAGIIELKS
eukprot:CAMPEP_0205801210 /NCGR_PEP_ID=MMETSP0205-20121125/3141_1 /ASSEMBLY_ACC=CAM_ASM_000278 /TAXON_ID=36767 /ORGANISM="Euplotes focardii, Strain TN1" /LENGTH=51 /DNA_ID=CAMNT_0053065615 /DNA_START=167 /DNA_END=322 /DNA_ORIENTATION=+